MIRLQLTSAKPKKSPEQLVQDAQWVAMLVEDERFKQLVEGMADDCIRTWADSKTLEARESAYTLLQGLRLMEGRLQQMMDAGVRAAKVGQ